MTDRLIYNLLAYLITSMVVLYPVSIVLAPLTVGAETTKIFTFGFKIIVSIVSCIAILHDGRIKTSLELSLIYSFFVVYIFNIIIFSIKTPVFLYSSPMMYFLNLIVNAIIPILLIKVFENNPYSINLTIKSILHTSPLYLLSAAYFFIYILSNDGISVLANRDSEMYVSPINLAYPASFIAAVFFDKFLNDESLTWRSYIFCILTTFIAFTLVILSGTRGALVALVLAMLCSFFLFSSKVSRKIFIIFFIVLLFLASLSFELIDLQDFAKINSLIYLLSSGDFSGESRISLLYRAYQEWSVSPFLGGNLYLSESGMYPHNIVLDLLLSTGIVGFLLFSGFLLSVCIKLIRVKFTPPIRFTAIGVLINFTMLNFSQSFILAYNLFIFLALLIASINTRRILI